MLDILLNVVFPKLFDDFWLFNFDRFDLFLEKVLD